MRIRFDETTRGGGKIFVHVSCDALPEGAALRASSKTRDGARVPAVLMMVPDVDGWVLVLAVLAVSQRVRLWVEDADGSVRHTASKTIAATAAKLHSYVNTATRNRLTEAIRNADVRHMPSFGLFVGMDELICAPDSGHDVVRGSVWLRSPRPQGVSRDALPEVELRVLDGRGRPAIVGPQIWRGAWQQEAEGATLRQTFSVWVAQDLPFLILWAVEPKSGREWLACYEDFALAEARDRWRGQTLSAWCDPAYHEWFVSRQRAGSRDLDLQRALALPDGPRFSVVAPLFRTPLAYLRDMVEGVLGQTYGRLELILVNASPEDEDLAQAVAAYARRDDRIRVVTLEKNEGIARNTLRGVDEARGDFVCFMDHDDLIEPDLLFRYARAVCEHPDTDLLYCDEDKLRDGRYVEPFLKPDWNPDLLCSQNYVCHLLTVRADIVRELPRDGYVACEGSQDHFLTLFAGERARNVWHERWVLYHWRVHPASTAAGGESKPYTAAAGVRAVQAHLDRMGVRAMVRERDDVANTYEVRYEVAGEPLVSIVIPNKDASGLLRRCVGSIVDKSTYANYEIIIVENNSVEEETFELYAQLESSAAVRVVREEGANGFNFSRTVNLGVSRAQGEYVLLLNNDTEVVTPDWLERLLGQCQRPEVGCVGAKLVYPDGLIQHAGVTMHHGAFKHIGRKLDGRVHDAIDGYQLTRDVSAVTGACLMVACKTLEWAGGLDEALPNDFNDTNLCLWLRSRGLLVVYEPNAELVHYESVTRGEHETKELRCQYAYSTGVMMSRWPAYFALGDPYWNPGLWADCYKHLQW